MYVKVMPRVQTARHLMTEAAVHTQPYAQVLQLLLRKLLMPMILIY